MHWSYVFLALAHQNTYSKCPTGCPWTQGMAALVGVQSICFVSLWLSYQWNNMLFGCSTYRFHFIPMNFFFIEIYCLTHWTLEGLDVIQANFSNWWLRYLFMKLPSCDCHWASLTYVSIGSGNGLGLSGNKPLPEAIMTPIYDAILRH